MGSKDHDLQPVLAEKGIEALRVFCLFLVKDVNVTL